MIFPELHSVDIELLLRQFHRARPAEELFELHRKVEPRLECRSFKVQAHESGSHIVVESLLLRFAILLQAGTIFLTVGLGAGFNAHVVIAGWMAFTFPGNGNKGELLAALGIRSDSFISG